MHTTAKALAMQSTRIAAQNEIGMTGMEPWQPPSMVTQEPATWPNGYRARIAREVLDKTETEDARLRWLITLARDLGIIHRIIEVTK